MVGIVNLGFLNLIGTTGFRSAVGSLLGIFDVLGRIWNFQNSLGGVIHLRTSLFFHLNFRAVDAHFCVGFTDMDSHGLVCCRRVGSLLQPFLVFVVGTVTWSNRMRVVYSLVMMAMLVQEVVLVMVALTRAGISCSVVISARRVVTVMRVMKDWLWRVAVMVRR